ncbi:MAG: hypothetical protein VKL60_15040 [Sphaerospermopsis sp.]|nr:hypothetical protein [Sphaerospermopsis sp.]
MRAESIDFRTKVITFKRANYKMAKKLLNKQPRFSVYGAEFTGHSLAYKDLVKLGYLEEVTYPEAELTKEYCS